VGEAEHLVAGRPPRHAGADGVDGPGEVAALARRERRRPALAQQPAADGGLARVDPRRRDPHPHLAVAGLGRVDLDHPQHVDLAVEIEPHGLHRHRTSSILDPTRCRPASIGGGTHSLRPWPRP
jgi:hypothetical protein